MKILAWMKHHNGNEWWHKLYSSHEWNWMLWNENSQRWWNWDHIEENDKLNFQNQMTWMKTTTWIFKNLSRSTITTIWMDEVSTNANETHKLLEEPRTYKRVLNNNKKRKIHLTSKEKERWKDKPQKDHLPNIKQRYSFLYVDTLSF